MKRFIYIIITLVAASCSMDQMSDPYSDDTLNVLTIEVSYPDGYSDYQLEGLTVSIEDIDNGNDYLATLDQEGTAIIELTNGRYLIQFSARHGNDIFNATADRVLLSNKNITVPLSPTCSVAGGLLIKEIYCGGCMKSPAEGTYHYDKYVVLHNNSDDVVYLDGLCYGMLDPYNSQASNIWVTSDALTGATIYADELYLVQAVWQIGGDGTTFPLAPGEDAVICNAGAIDHTSQYPLSVNLNNEDYFVLYDNVLFDNTYYHPAPGDNISPDRYLNVAIKLGVANAWPFSVYSPAPLFFFPQGRTIEEYILEPDAVFWKPGSNYDQIMRIPLDWVVDGVEVFYGGSSSNSKRFNPIVDAGYVLHTALYDGKSLHRYVDEQASSEAGYEVLIDTNNSSVDFYERSQASLKDE
ncbi:MAG: DUF4876 domain-containing protein [Rikenellaceae bacterium]